MELTVTDRPDVGRYEVSAGDRVLGLAAYQRRGEQIVFTPTQGDPDAGGSGIGSTPVPGALDDVRARELRAVPCARSSAPGSTGTPTTPTWSTPRPERGPLPPPLASSGRCWSGGGPHSTWWPYISPSGSAISSIRAPSGSRK